MLAKLSVICYVHDCTNHITREFTLKQLIATKEVEDDNPSKIVFLKTKVNATSIKVVDLDFDNMPVIDLNIIISTWTTQTVKIVDGYSTLDFYVEERLGDREASNFWVEVKHLTNNSYLSSKTNSINQNLRSTTAILVGTIYYHKLLYTS
ncbi:hypothetical protein F8M41_012375 [Gigaspora margarita]|uniref:Uncharacterized protein n=1 Tax=Gigaspora margarita TaxID=4874 RepID=A0A8H4EPT8_GIGMA|nr:hypothetical protein F8M41_012375 [Gigaspora margarita]